MIRRLALAAFLALASLSLGGVAFLTPPPFFASSVPCADTSLHTVTTSSASSVTIAAGCHHIALGIISPGGAGAAQTSSSHPTGGGAGAFAGGTISVTPGGTLWWQLYAGAPRQTSGPAAGANGQGKSWASVTSNAPPATSSDGVMADFGVGGGLNGTAGTGGLTANSVGQVLHAGGNGYRPTTSVYGGGGSSACPLSDGNNATSATGASACTGGGNGGNGLAATASSGGAPGGGGGAASGSGNSGAGGASQLTYQQSASLDLSPANNNIHTMMEAV